MQGGGYSKCSHNIFLEVLLPVATIRSWLWWSWLVRLIRSLNYSVQEN